MTLPDFTLRILVALLCGLAVGGDRRRARAGVEPWSLVRVGCRRPAEAEVRTSLLKACGQESLIARAVPCTPASGTETIRLDATVAVHGHGQDVVERLAHRLGTHP